MKLKIMLSAMLLILMSITPSVVAEVATENVDHSNDAAEDVLNSVVESMNTNDWVKYSSYFSNSNEINLFRESKENIKNQSGYLSIKSAKLISIKSLDEVVYSKYVPGVDVMKKQYSELEVFYTAIDYCVSRESKYYQNGVNFELFVLGNSDDRWEVVRDQVAPVDLIQYSNEGFGTSEEKARAIQFKNFKGTGILRNKKGEIIDSVRATPKQLEQERNHSEIKGLNSVIDPNVPFINENLINRTKK